MHHIKCGDLEIADPILNVLEKIGLILRVYNMKIAEATYPFLMKSNPSSAFPLNYLEITVNQSVTAKPRAN